MLYAYQPTRSTTPLIGLLAVIAVTAQSSHALPRFVDTFLSTEVTAPRDIAVHVPTGNVYITEYGGNGAVKVFSPSGSLIKSFGAAHLREPSDIAISENTVYVLDKYYALISPEHSWWDVTVFSSSGSQLDRDVVGEFSGPRVIVGPKDIVSSSTSLYIPTWSEDNTFIQQFDTTIPILKRPHFGVGLSYPDQIALSPTGDVFVSVNQDNGVHIFQYSSNGNFLTSFNTKISLFGISDMAFSPSGTLNLSDRHLGLIKRFDVSGAELPSVDVGLISPGEMAFTNSGNGLLYIIDDTGNGVTVKRLFDADEWTTGTYPIANDLIIQAGSPVDDHLFIGPGKDLNVTSGVRPGNSANGSLTIVGGKLTSGFGIIGNTASAVGNATITGPGSTWTMTPSILVVGQNGTGHLTVNNGGQVVSDGGIIGRYAGSSGTATIDGPNSSWSMPDRDLQVAAEGNGSLSILDGATVSSIDGWIGIDPAASGNVLVKGSGSTWDLSSELTIANEGTGSLLIQDGGDVTNKHQARIGWRAGSVGSATVQGSGSTFVNDNHLFVGDAGTGSLLINAGAYVSNSDGVIGNATTGLGTVQVTSGATWQNSGTLIVGDEGIGNLDLSDDGFVASQLAFIGLQPGSHGTATVDGASTLSIVTDLSVGHDGHGSLTISNNSSVFVSAKAFIGTTTGTGVVTVNGSTWHNSDNLEIGRDGHGTLLITNGGNVSNTDGGIGLFPTGNGSVNVSGGAWTNTGSLEVGVAGVGTLSIRNGGRVFSGDSSDIRLGGLEAGRGDIHVSGIDSLLDIGRNIVVANLGSGLLTIAEGGVVLAEAGTIGFEPGSSGTVTVDGAGTTWNNSLQIFVGRAGDGNLIIRNGALVENLSSTANSVLGNLSGATGHVIIQDPGSRWLNAAGLRVGLSGSGRLDIVNGGLLQTQTLATIGSTTGSDGTVLVDGTGSTWDHHSDLLLGNSAAVGSLTVSNNASVTILQEITIGDLGTLTISNGSLTADQATNANQINLIGGSLTLANGGTNNPSAQINAINATLDFGTGLTNNGELNLINTTVLGDVASPVGSSISVVGTTSFMGAITGDADFTGTGTVIIEQQYSPGDSPGAVNFGGNLHFGDNATLTIELANPATGPTTTPDPGSDHDQVNVTNNVTLDGTLDITLLDGFTPTYGDTFEIFTYGGIRSGTFSKVTGHFLSPALALGQFYDTITPNTLTLLATAPGDANGDLIVTIDDFGVLAGNFNQPGTWETGDFDGDGMTTINDFGLLAANFNGDFNDLAAAAESFGITIPEPGVAMLLGLATIGFVIQRRERSLGATPLNSRVSFERSV